VERNRDEFRILCSGDPREFKGTRTVQEAVEEVKAEVPGLVLDTYHGKNYPQDKMAAVYSAADLFIDATWDSGSGWNNPVLEAMACRVPVICTDIGGVADFAQDGRTALLVPPGDTAALVGAIRHMVRSVELRVELAALAYEKSLDFDWDTAAEKLQKMLKIHLERGNQPT
jgi:glycosyltransferase involved in cell wall biosynthesis